LCRSRRKAHTLSKPQLLRAADMDRGLAHRFLDAFTGFLLVAANVAFVSSFFPLIPTVIPSAFLPVGPLSIPLVGFLYLYFWSMEISPPLLRRTVPRSA